MIIFRFKPAILSLLCLVGACTETTVDESAEDILSQYKGVEIWKDGRRLNEVYFIQKYGENPNFYPEKFFKGNFRVAGEIAEIGLYDEYGLEKADNDFKVQYYIPLMAVHPTLNMGEFPSVGLFMKDFSREKAAKLVVGHRVVATCEKMRVTGESTLAFDACVLFDENEG